MPAAETQIVMAAERRRAAANDRIHHLAVLESEMRSMALDEAAA
jgi:hypothetical protein